ncbi:unnamed protein product [Effrenium voratum]|nr:unnamed protein product [Effrenium voratum]
MDPPGLADLASPWLPAFHFQEPRVLAPSSKVVGAFECAGGAERAEHAEPGELWPGRFYASLAHELDAGASSESTALCSQGPQDELEMERDEPRPTTVMMRNIPSEFTGRMLLTLLNIKGFKGLYDLVYLPMDYHNKVGFGYAFINFVEADQAQHFRAAFEGFRDWQVESDKVCEVCWSNVLQGVAAHVERYRNSPVMHPSVPATFKPMLFKNGEQIAFPAPTKTVRPPRLRKKAL